MEPDWLAIVMGRMTGDRFRTRANECIKEAAAAIEPDRKLFLLDAAQRWLRLAAEIDAGAFVARLPGPFPSHKAPRVHRGAW